LDKVTKKKRSQIMAAIRSKNTKPEITLRKALWAKGLRFRIYYGKEKIDIAFPSQKLAIFVDGCFWHGCPIHRHIPRSNREYWLPKLRRNEERDRSKQDRLILQGWKVLRFWEHELADIEGVLEKIRKIMAQR
jgi:DNA mismatch endonuclease (patch repair protein)